jgi:uncharacterized protein (DUF1778 family)
MRTGQNRTARLEARMTRRSLPGVRRAAEEAAQKTIADAEVIRLSREGQEKFAELLMSPPPPAPALIRALKRRRELIAK